MPGTPPTDWAKFYQQNLSGAAAADSESSGMMITSTNLSSTRGSSTPNLSLSEGRVSKPAHARRRSRASSRTPTTLLNTDTTNFRAMVQQFTGDPNVSFASTTPAQRFSFALGTSGNRPNPNPNPNYNLSSSSLVFSPGYGLQYQPQNQGQGYMISMSNVNNHVAAAGDHGFFQRLGGNPRPPPPEMGSDGVLMEMNINASSSSSRAAPSNSSENRGNGFIF